MNAVSQDMAPSFHPLMFPLPSIISGAMLSANTNMLISHAFLLLGLVAIPLVTAVIVRAALKGKPHNFGRDMYGIAFVVTCAGFLFVGNYAQRMSADVRTWQYVVQTLLMGLVEL